MTKIKTLIKLVVLLAMVSSDYSFAGGIESFMSDKENMKFLDVTFKDITRRDLGEKMNLLNQGDVQGMTTLQRLVSNEFVHMKSIERKTSFSSLFWSYVQFREVSKLGRNTNTPAYLLWFERVVKSCTSSASEIHNIEQMNLTAAFLIDAAYEVGKFPLNPSGSYAKAAAEVASKHREIINLPAYKELNAEVKNLILGLNSEPRSFFDSAWK